MKILKIGKKNRNAQKKIMVITGEKKGITKVGVNSKEKI
jgi:hypothetical protein